MKKKKVILTGFIFTTAFLGLLTAQSTMAQPVQPCITTNDQGITICKTDPVPVPYNTNFWRGPAGEVTASGVVIGVINILLALVGVIAVLYLIVGGFRYVTSGGNEEQAEVAKKNIQHAILGLAIVVLSFVVIRIIVAALVSNRT